MKLFCKKIFVASVLFLSLFSFHTNSANFFSHTMSSVATTVCQQPVRATIAGALALGGGIMTKMTVSSEAALSKKVGAFAVGASLVGCLGWACYASYPKLTTAAALLWGVLPIAAMIGGKILARKQNKSHNP